MDYGNYLSKLLEETVKKKASDLHVNAGFKPSVRVDGDLMPIPSEPVLTPEASEGIMMAMLDQKKRERFLKERQLDVGYNFQNKSRFRVNVYYQKGFVSGSFRLIPQKIMTLDEMGMPPILHSLSGLSQGFILIVGPAGHGKSATVAAVIDEINNSRREHVVTIEDPIEYLFTSNKSIISQREVGLDTIDFHAGLKSVLRQDPDVVMIGEMRDMESISTAMTAAETGHLVISTLHTNSAAQTIDRIIDVFPSEKQAQAASQLAATLVAIVSKRLIPKIGGGRAAAAEVLLSNSAVQNMIRERKTHQIDLVIETNLKSGMVSLNRSLAQLVKEKKITMETAQLHSLNPRELQALVKK